MSRRAQFLALAIQLVFALLLAAGTPVSQGLPPTCTPIPVNPFAILYQGTTSGCSNQLGRSQLCFAGETIIFNFGDHEILCPERAVYNWQFTDSSAVGWRVNHTFTRPGTYTVSVTLIDVNGSRQFAQTVTIVDPASVPAIRPELLIVLVLLLALIATHELKRL